jgi:hypothetical protein
VTYTPAFENEAELNAYGPNVLPATTVLVGPSELLVDYLARLEAEPLSLVEQLCLACEAGDNCDGPDEDEPVTRELKAV